MRTPSDRRHDTPAPPQEPHDTPAPPEDRQDTPAPSGDCPNTPAPPEDRQDTPAPSGQPHDTPAPSEQGHEIPAPLDQRPDSPAPSEPGQAAGKPSHPVRTFFRENPQVLVLLVISLVLGIGTFLAVLFGLVTAGSDQTTGEPSGVILAAHTALASARWLVA